METINPWDIDKTNHKPHEVDDHVNKKSISLQGVKEAIHKHDGADVDINVNIESINPQEVKKANHNL